MTGQAQLKVLPMETPPTSENVVDFPNPGPTVDLDIFGKMKFVQLIATGLPRWEAVCYVWPDRFCLTKGKASTMATGTVAKFMDNKGFGFITPDGGGKDIFVHHSDIKMDGFKTLSPGQRVQFEVSQEAKGPKASNVMPIK